MKHPSKILPAGIHPSPAAEKLSTSESQPPDVVLMAVTGMSPAILTETLWALAHEPEPIIPTRIIAVTTSTGRDRIVNQLLSPSAAFNGLSPWDALRASLVADGHLLDGRFRFGSTADDLRIITAMDNRSGKSRELADIRSREDSEAAADYLLDQVRGFTENPDIQLIVSLAGGRKTMGALIYACMTLVGRETDRLTHVLVTEPFEVAPGFWFPSQPGGSLQFPRGSQASDPLLDPTRAVVELADVPFVPLRNLFHRELGKPAGTFRRLVDLCRRNVRLTAGDHLRLEVDRSRPISSVNGRILELAPREHFLLLFFAERTKRGETIVGAYDELLTDLNEARQRFRNEAPPNNWSDWRRSPSLDNAFEERSLIRVLSDLRSKAKLAGGDAAYLAGVLPEKGRVTLDIPASLIFIKN